jgi:hypothetical protein
MKKSIHMALFFPFEPLLNKNKGSVSRDFYFFPPHSSFRSLWKEKKKSKNEEKKSFLAGSEWNGFFFCLMDWKEPI